MGKQQTKRRRKRHNTGSAYAGGVRPKGIFSLFGNVRLFYALGALLMLGSLGVGGLYGSSLHRRWALQHARFRAARRFLIVTGLNLLGIIKPHGCIARISSSSPAMPGTWSPPASGLSEPRSGALSDRDHIRVRPLYLE